MPSFQLVSRLQLIWHLTAAAASAIQIIVSSALSAPMKMENSLPLALLKPFFILLRIWFLKSVAFSSCVVLLNCCMLAFFKLIGDFYIAVHRPHRCRHICTRRCLLFLVCVVFILTTEFTGVTFECLRRWICNEMFIYFDLYFYILGKMMENVHKNWSVWNDLCWSNQSQIKVSNK